jgi:magnesium chelatase subunit I
MKSTEKNELNNMIQTLGELKASTYQSKSIKEELRDNLIQHIQAGTTPFQGVHGFENTVIPDLERALLSKHNINLLGLRGQAKTRLARLMVHLLDEYIPYVAGSEIHDDPYNPISRFAIETIAEQGDRTPIAWLHRSERFTEKLATPDVTVADLIGDIDPIKAAHLKLTYADDRVIHYGMIPRSNRCIFVINEIPDLQARIQVALFNILQEGDIQIRGFKLRLPLDIQFVFTANPEDYTNRGSIITPLKDRIGSQILTHYPENRDIARKISQQEAQLSDAQTQKVRVPEVAYNVLEQIIFEARKSEYIDQKSGVSARMGISMLERLMSTAELRALKNREEHTTVRLSDFMGVIPAITGKVELVYEGEQEGSAYVAEQLIREAVKTLLPEHFPRIEKLSKKSEASPYDELLAEIIANGGIILYDDHTDAEYQETLNGMSALNELVQHYLPEIPEWERPFFKELLLWGLAEHEKIGKERLQNGFDFGDLF